MSVVAEQARTTPVVREVAAELLPRTPELGRAMADYLYAAIPELAVMHDDELRAELLASTSANVGQVLRLLAHGASTGDAVVPSDALGFLRGIVRRGIPLAALLRSYRLGHAWLWERWSQALQDRVADSGELAAGQDHSSALMFAYVDKVCDVLVDEFGTERDRMMRSAAQQRAETVRAILGGEPVDEEAASRRLGYDLRLHHVALRVSSGASEVRGLERAVADAAATLAIGKPLVVPSGAARFDLWCGSFDPPATDRLERYEPVPGVLIAFGRPAEGVGGFLRSHVEALQAARIRSLAPAGAAAVTSYARVELVSLLATDLPRARTFVASRLGRLDSAAESSQRLRDTVLAYLVAGGSASRVAKDLYVHQNTVAYRVKKAEELLGRKVSENSIELTCALKLAAALGPAVLDDGSVHSEDARSAYARRRSGRDEP
ncbi:PucR family transcriptional regulator [Candidatus Solirubrobacter pratensis]|uniref:PucR family transcriptional regulator n=1 Tax=Candidatus Solirubrobacter pratensis TaxID=1298857 RepID=UPI0012DD6901|nr:helix-turn-helix domain-containing protein [Candidatus Solirubrobacter pratensis]